MRLALYARVSTDKQQYANQLAALTEYCKNKGYEIVATYEEAEHGNYPESKRPKFLEMMDDAAKHKFDAILVWALDRLTREGVYKTWHYITQLQAWRVGFISYQESYINTTSDNELVRDLMLSIMAIMAKQERARISERTKAALDRARKEIAEKGFYTTKAGKRVEVIGKALSYPPQTLLEIQQLRATVDHRTGKLISIYKIGKMLNLNTGKVKYAIDHLLPKMEEPINPAVRASVLASLAEGHRDAEIIKSLMVDFR